MEFDKLLTNFNQNQKKAVLSNNKKIMVLAGAGSGKTTVLTGRVSRIISQLKVLPENILVLTFTNKASKEMGERIAKNVSDDAKIQEMWLGTFHSVCNRILRSSVELTNLSQGFQIIDASEQESFIKKIIKKLKSEKSLFISEESLKSAHKDSARIINKCKERMLRPNSDGVDTFINSLSKDIDFDVLRVYEEYEKERVLSNIVDFTDIILYVVELFRDFEEVRVYFSKKFRHILVDEFQDTNDLQYKFIFDLLNNKSNLFVVGDDDQLIYGWRGANIENIQNLPEMFNDIEIIKLVDNYRSTKTILDAANAVISNNTLRFDKSLVSNKEIGEKIKIYKCDNPDREAENIADEILKIKNENNLNFSDFCILYRVNSASRAFEKVFTNKNIKYHLIGSVGFWSRKEVKDIMSYLMLAINPSNNVAFDRVVNTPTRGFGGKFLESVYAESANTDNSYFRAIKNMILKNQIKGKKLNEAKIFIELIESLQSMIAKNLSIDHLVEKVMSVTNYEDLELEKEKDEDKKQERLFNMKELISIASSFKKDELEEGSTDLEAFISYASLQASVDKNTSSDGVKLMTVHMAKGLEFPYVFTVGMEDGLFPLKRGGASLSKMELEEERRLAYVAFTRAQKRLYISYSVTRFRNTFESSPFIDEIPKNIVEKVNLQNFGYQYKNQNLGRVNPKLGSSGDSELERIKRELLRRKNL